MMVVVPSPIVLPPRDHLLIVSLVSCAHILLLWHWVSLPNLSKSAHHEMAVSLALPQTSVLAPTPQVKAQPVKPEPLPAPVPQAAVTDIPEEIPASLPPAEISPGRPENASPGISDREPDYQAAYLNNPLPGYPKVARRMGWQGRVVLNVEVLENGSPGQIKLHQSSGRDVLDNAALQAVRGWRFVAARQNGQVVAKWFLVPIPFVLKEAE